MTEDKTITEYIEHLEKIETEIEKMKVERTQVLEDVIRTYGVTWI